MNFAKLVNTFTTGVLQPLIGLLLAAGLVYFLWGVLKYIKEADNEDKRREAKEMMLHGIIALFVMVSVWGLVNILAGTFNLSNQAPPIPYFPPSSR